MKPTQLKPGQRVVITPSLGGQYLIHGTFIKRVPRYYGRAAYSVIRVQAFAGLNGDDDLGDVHLSDYDVSRRVSLEGKQ